jgi:trigger factor
MVIVDYVAQSDDFRHPAEGRERAASVIGGNTALAAFDGALKGHAAGEELSFDAEFPPTFPIPQLAAKQAKVELRIGEVQASHMPEVDADFIRNFGIGDGSPETFRTEVRANLERELENALRARLRNEVGSKLAATTWTCPRCWNARKPSRWCVRRCRPCPASSRSRRPHWKRRSRSRTSA